MDTTNETDRGPAVYFFAAGKSDVRIDPRAMPPATSLTLGSHVSCRVRIEGEGVRPLHAEIFWDGKALWVGPGLPGATIEIDGTQVGGWMRVGAIAELRIADVLVRMVPEHAHDTTDFGDAESTSIRPSAWDDEATTQMPPLFDDSEPEVAATAPSAPDATPDLTPVVVPRARSFGAPPAPDRGLLSSLVAFFSSLVAAVLRRPSLR